MSERNTVLVAIDGPAGSGKSSVAFRVAEALGVPHIDTGAYYRAAALVVLRAAISTEDPDEICGIVARVKIERHGGRTFLNGEDVEEEIRDGDVTATVSDVAKHPQVRRLLVGLQQAAVGVRGGVVEGRDAGTVVVPDADLKVFLDASVAERARRRAEQRGEPERQNEYETAIRERDERDAAQMVPDPSVVHLDTTTMTQQDVVDRIVELATATER